MDRFEVPVMGVIQGMFPSNVEKCQRQKNETGENMPVIAGITGRGSFPRQHLAGNSPRVFWLGRGARAYATVVWHGDRVTTTA